MSAKEKHICRLCLKVAKNEFEVDEVMKQMFEILLLNVDFDITRDPIICQDCMEVSKECLHFKWTCIHTEQIILSYSTDTNKEVKLNHINVIYELSERIPTVLEDFKICRFCMTQFETSNFVSLDTLSNKNIFEMLSPFMTEMDFNAIENPLICTDCRENLQGYIKFVLNCLESEEKLKTYCKERGTDSMGQVKLDNVIQFTFTDVLEYPDKCPQTCKIEQDHLECVYPETYIESIKQEELEIKDEEIDHQSSISVDRGVKMHKCSLCPYEDKQQKYVSDIKMFKCPLCPYEAKQKRYLNKHMLVHKDVSDIKMYKCPLCSYEAKQRWNLNRHMLAHKDISEIKTYKCSLCPYEGKQKHKVTTHMLSHKDVSEIQMYKCSSCPFETKHKGSLKNHMIIHKNVSEIKMHECSLCAFESKYKSNLKAHMIIHEKKASTKWLEKYKIA